MVKDLKIWNRYGSVQWKGVTNIFNTNFAKGIEITECGVDITIK